MIDIAAPIEYRDAHRRIRRVRGRARDYLCATCGGQAHQWALRHDVPAQQSGWVTVKGRSTPSWLEWSADPAHYSPTCRSCHVAADRAHAEELGRTFRPGMSRLLADSCRRGHRWTEESTYVYYRPERGGAPARQCKVCGREREAATRAAKRGVEG